jgi:hypothetical protein
VDKEHAKKLGNEVAKLSQENTLKAFRDKDSVIFVIQDAPEELRKLADALEKVNVREIQALIAFKQPDPKQPPARP